MFELLCLVALAAFATFVSAADCTTATVGSPYNDCFDIYTNASLTAAQFAADKPGLNCSLLQIGQQVCISSGTLPSTAPSASANGTCYEYFVDPNDSCSSIAVKFDITVAEIETYNINTFKCTGCAGLQAGFTMCVSPGTPPPIPVIPDLECGPQSAGNATCPLNACCSAFGFCGLTEEFCTTAVPPEPLHIQLLHVNPALLHHRPQHEEHRLLRGLADRRPCGVVRPGDIDWSGYTHAHFAFAVISQDSEIQLASADEPLLQELVGLKASNPSMKVLISIGGWDFLEADPTRHLFSIMIGSAATRSTFISSVQTFLTTYDLDGIDIDFEYPGAIERDAPATRSGNPEDYKGANISVDMLGATRVTAKLCREFIKILCLQLE
ncbi:glycoside hydrolase superfamily [Mycena galericulata]|nr:glycoside hydrolase superfamily [Mycena galericulata]